MKGRLNSTVWMLIGINAVALIGVLGLAYMAGKSGESSPMMLVGAAGLALVASFLFVSMLNSKVLSPVKQLADFSERVAANDYKARLDANSADDFGFVAANLNRSVDRMAKVASNQDAQESLQRSVTEFLTIVSQIARGD